MFFSSFTQRLSNHARAALQYLTQRQSKKLSSFLHSLHPAEVAALINCLDRNIHPQLLKHIRGLDHLAQLIEHASEDLRTAAMTLLDEARIAAITRRLNLPLSAHIISILPKKRQQKVLSHLSKGHLELLIPLLAFSAGQAGRMLNPEFISSTPTTTAKDALSLLQNHFSTKKRSIQDATEELYITDTDGKLIGYVKLFSLLASKPETPLSEITEEPLLVLSPESEVSNIARFSLDCRLSSVPVCDVITGNLLGIIALHDLAMLTRREQSRDMLRICGTEERDTINAQFATALKSRSPWLLLSLLSGIAIAELLLYFSATFERSLALLFFIPAILSLSGHTALENAAISVRGIIGGKFGRFRVRERLRKECIIGSAIGASVAVILFVVSILSLQNLRLSAAIAGASFLSILLSTPTGAMLPAALYRIGIAPSSCSSTLLKAITDLLTIVIFCLIACLLI